MGDFSKGGVHKTNELWGVIFQRGEYTKPMVFDGVWNVFFVAFKRSGRLFWQIRYAKNSEFWIFELFLNQFFDVSKKMQADQNCKMISRWAWPCQSAYYARWSWPFFPPIIRTYRQAKNRLCNGIKSSDQPTTLTTCQHRFPTWPAQTGRWWCGLRNN